MKFLGIDFGQSKIGLAVSEGNIAKPLGVVSSKRQVVEICQRDEIETIIMGISEGKMAVKTRKFGQELQQTTNLPIEYWDETLTSQKAQEIMNQAGKPRMKKKSSEHTISAALILQDYLDNQL